jgi:hypothetical protein
MGRRGIAYCPCGYTQDVSYGGNRNNFQTVDLFPFLCRSCKSIFSSNRRDRTHPCTHCESTDTSSYRKGSLKQYRRPRRVVVTEPIVDIEILEPLQERPKGLLPRIWYWFFPKPKLLPLRPIEKRVVKDSPVEPRVVTEPEDQGYFCPRCDKFTLSFEQTAFTD